MVLGRHKNLEDSIKELRHLLPVQGPIETFIHHNTLHSFEHLHFEEAVELAGKVYGARSYLSEDQYRRLYAEGRITADDIDAELAPFLIDDTTIGHPNLNRSSLRRSLIYLGLGNEDVSVSRWKQSETRLHLRQDLSPHKRSSLIQETRQWIINMHGAGEKELLTELTAEATTSPSISRIELANFIRVSDSTIEGELHADALTAALLWHAARVCTRKLEVCDSQLIPHHAEALLEIVGIDIFEQVHTVLIQLCSAFTDQGVSHWPMPGRVRGFLAVVQDIFSQRGIPSASWINRAEGLFRGLKPSSLGARAALSVSLDKMGVPEDLRGHFITHAALKLKGWAGFFALLETTPSIARDRPVHASLEDFLAVQNLLLLAAIEDIAHTREIRDFSLPELQLRAQQRTRTHYVRSARQRMTRIVFEVAQMSGISPQVLIEGGETLATAILQEEKAFPEIVRERIWQLSYERASIRTAVGAFANHSPARVSSTPPRAQILFCIDEREESFRRHLEEISSNIDTFGYPGFFNLPLAFRGIHHLHFEALCPVVMEPHIYVVERDAQSPQGRRDNMFRRLFSWASRELQALTRTPIGGSVVSTIIGHFALVPFFLRVLRPTLAGRVHDAFHTPEIRESDFKISLGRGTKTDEQLTQTIGQELSAVFQTIGIPDSAAPLVVIMGHGSSSLNNPHESAHDCGACGGKRGAPSARLFSRFANDPKIRVEMQRFGVRLTPETYVLGAYHDTCDDTVTVFDEQLIPETHRKLTEQVVKNCREASSRNALERSRRFLTSQRNLSPKSAAEALVGRAEDFSEPRPEYGHATNGIAFIGRRTRCRGLFLDRRAFLSSYDPNQDQDGKVLQALLAAVVPVCAGINLEYYFSRVDSTNYGAGTKLPHNIVGQIGVMDGAISDLRTGLPWQMVEIHEPVRLVMLVEATVETLESVLARLPKVKTLLDNRWIWLLAVAPGSSEFALYSNGKFNSYDPSRTELPRISDSLSYCIHTSNPLPFASVVGANSPHF